MSNILKKTYPSPALLSSLSGKDYYDTFAKAIRQLQETPADSTDTAEGCPFFYLIGQSFSDDTMPLVWVGSLNAAWKQFYKASRKEGGFVGGTVLKSNELGNESIPYKFVIEEGKGAKKGFLQAVRKTIKQWVGKNIEFILPAYDTEDETAEQTPEGVGSSAGSLFERLRQSITQYEQMDGSKTPLLKMELRLQLDTLLTQWNQTGKSTDKTAEQRKFVQNFALRFRSGDSIYRDRAFELWGLQKKAETDYKTYMSEKANALQSFSSTPSADARPALRDYCQGAFAEWIELQRDLTTLRDKQKLYFESGYTYLSAPDAAAKIQLSVKSNTQKLLDLTQIEIDRSRQQFIQLGGKEQHLADIAPPQDAFTLPTPATQPPPALSAHLDRYNQLLQQYHQQPKQQGTALQQQIGQMNAWAAAQQQEWAKQIAQLRTALTASNPADPQTQKINYQLNTIITQQRELQHIQEQLFLAQKELALSSGVDTVYLNVLQAQTRFQKACTAYTRLATDKTGQDLAAATENTQFAIDLLEACIQTWQEAHPDLSAPDTQTRSAEMDQIRASILDFVRQYPSFECQSAAAAAEAVVLPPYLPEQDTLYLQQVQKMLDSYPKNREELVKTLVNAHVKYKATAEAPFFDQCETYTSPRLHTLRNNLADISEWRITTRSFALDNTLQTRLDKAKNTEIAIRQEMIVLNALQKIDLLALHANRACKKQSKAQQDKQKWTEQHHKLLKLDTSKLKPEQMEVYKKGLVDAALKIAQQDTAIRTQSWAAIEALQPLKIYTQQIQLNTPHLELLAVLPQLAALGTSYQQGDSNQFVETQIAHFQKVYQDVALSGMEGTAFTDALHALANRISPFLWAIRKTEIDSHLSQKLQRLLDSIHTTIMLTEGDSGGMGTIAEAIVSKYDQLAQAAPNTAVVSGLELLARAIGEWEMQYGDCIAPLARHWADKLRSTNKNIQKILERDDIETVRLRLDIENLLKQCRNELNMALEMVTNILSSTTEQTTDAQNKLLQLRPLIAAFDLRCNNIQAIPEAHTLQTEITQSVLQPIRTIYKTLVLDDMQLSVAQEKKTLAVLGDGFHPSLSIPPAEQMLIDSTTQKANTRIEQLLELGESPQSLLPQIAHLPVASLPDQLIPQLQQNIQKSASPRSEAVVLAAWQAVKANTPASDIQKAIQLFEQATRGDYELASVLLSKSAFYAHLLVVGRSPAAWDYCLAHQIMPQDLEQSVYSKKLLLDYLLTPKTDKAITISLEKEIQEAPELDKVWSEKIKLLSKEAKQLLVVGSKKIQQLFKSLDKVIPSLLAFVQHNPPLLQQKGAIPIDKVLGETENKEWELLAVCLLQYQEIMAQTGGDPILEAFFKQLAPAALSQMLLPALPAYRAAYQQWATDCNNQLQIAAQNQQPDQVLALSQQQQPIKRALQRKLRLLETIQPLELV